MLIFNTTFLVADRVQDKWLTWVNQQHIPFMLGSGSFSEPQVARVLCTDENEGTSYSVQFHIADMAALEDWNARYAATFQQNCADEFGENALFFATVLEIM